MTETKIVLIGGVSGAGKTTLGRALAKKLDAISLTADDLALAARAVTTPETHPDLHRMNIPNAANYFTDSTVQKLIDDAEAQHEAVWPAIERVIQVRSKEKHSMVIDGWFMHPSWVAALDHPNVHSFWLVAERHVLYQREQTLSHMLGKSSDHDRMLHIFLGRSYWYNDLINKEATEYNMNILRQDGTVTLEDLCTKVISQLG